MKIKCVFRDSIGFVRIIDLDADSVEEATVGLHEKCQDGRYYRILYRNDDIQEDTISLASVVGDEKVVLVDDPPFINLSENQQGFEA